VNTSLTLDHLVLVASTLEIGVAHVEATLGVAMAGGGAHPGMATHNRLLRLGDIYLEVLARDPSATPTRARWFGLDDLRLDTRPSLHTFVLRSAAIDATLASMPEVAGPAIAAQRGALRWRIGVPDNGHMPFDGAFPTIIEWPDGTGPVASMPDSGCRLASLEIRHPQATEIARILAPQIRDDRIAFHDGPLRLQATIETKTGAKRL
jgi:hypothetical protein